MTAVQKAVLIIGAIIVVIGGLILAGQGARA